MKSKRKLDAKAIKQFFIDHTEKIAIGVVGLLFLYFAYSAVMLQANDSYTKAPKNLDEAVQAAVHTMEIGPTSKTPATEAPIKAYANITEHFKVALDIKDYPTDNRWNKKVFAQKNRRETPAVIPVEELRAVAGRGALPGKDNGGTVGQRWISVTGLVPYAKQLAEYKAKFDTAGRVGDHDTPEYIGFLVQRAEVVPGAASEPNWDKAVTLCNESFLSRQLEKWTGAAPEVVDSKYVYPGLTSQLPPRVTGEWGDEAAHPSEIKLLTPEEKDQMVGGGQGGQPIAPRGQPLGGRGGRMPPGRGENGFIPRPRTRVGGEGGRFPGGTPRAGGDQAGDDLFGRNAGGANEPAANTKPVDETVQFPAYYLLRYFDFDVEPGKQYAYRVYPLLRNPNDGLPESALVDPLQHNQRMLSVAPGKERPDANNKVADLKIDDKYWSNACQSTRLPGDNRLVAGTVEPAKSPSPTEITGQVRIIRWDADTGANKYAEKASVFRGTPLDPAFEDAVWKPKAEDDANPKPKPETNSILVDWMGGDMLSPRDREKSPHSPGAMLVVNENGELVIHDEESEAKDWADATKEPDQPGVRGSGRGEMPGRGRYPRSRGEGGGRPPRGGELTPRPDSSLPDMAPSGR